MNPCDSARAILEESEAAGAPKEEPMRDSEPANEKTGPNLAPRGVFEGADASKAHSYEGVIVVRPRNAFKFRTICVTM